MKKLFKVLLFLFACQSVLLAQDLDSRVLLTINGKDITAGEFLWLYEKNNYGESTNTISEYLDLYILFRLKVEAAIDEGMDRKDSFTDELNGYRKQLARNYLSDQEIKEELLQKAYKRYLEEINVYHIMVKCPADASPADTLEAYKKAIDIRERIRLGESFTAVAKGASDDPTARFNGGNLGYITVFQTPLKFEDAVYSMSPGMLSRPVRTSEGYHIIKVQDRRDNSGRVKVAHIMKACPPGSSDKEAERAKAIIDTIYKELLAGIPFEDLAGKYSDDKGSAGSGGELPWFGAGEMIHEFSEESFSLLRNGDISPPFRTLYGWHIIKRLEKENPLPYDEARRILESKMSHSYLESLSKKSFVDKLKKEYDFTVDRSSLDWFYSVADSVFRSGNYKWNEKDIPRGNIYTFSGKALSNRLFADYISSMGKRAYSNDSIKFINTLLDLKSYDDLVKYEDSVLEKKYPEFGFLMKEFHDGILMFEISNKELWSKLDEDDPGLFSYWESRKNEFMSDEEISCRIASISPDAGKGRTKKLTRVLRKQIKTDIDDENLAEYGKYASRNLVTVESGTFKKGENSILDKIRKSRGTMVVSDDNGTHIVYISEIKEAKPKTFEEAREYLIDDYQALLEKNWQKQLREKYDVKINENVLNLLIKENR
jgi:peptidyl-prolyl cis-trans isomerase SurA